jgi:putative DNA primase/helicase
VETALAAMAKGFRPVWSTGSAGLMAAFPILIGVEALTLFADNDLSGAGLRAANEVAGRWRSAGRRALIYLWEAMGDLNDAFQELDR